MERMHSTNPHRNEHTPSLPQHRATGPGQRVRARRLPRERKQIRATARSNAAFDPRVVRESHTPLHCGKFRSEGTTDHRVNESAATRPSPYIT